MNWRIAGPEIFYFAAGLFFLLWTFIGDGSRSRKAPLEAGRAGGLPNPASAARRMHLAALSIASVGILVCLVSVGMEGRLFIRAYRVDIFSQVSRR